MSKDKNNFLINVFVEKGLKPYSDHLPVMPPGAIDKYYFDTLKNLNHHRLLNLQSER